MRKVRTNYAGSLCAWEIDRYGEVFHISYFYQNRDEYLGYMLFRLLTKQHEPSHWAFRNYDEKINVFVNAT